MFVLHIIVGGGEHNGVFVIYTHTHTKRQTWVTGCVYVCEATRKLEQEKVLFNGQEIY